MRNIPKVTSSRDFMTGTPTKGFQTHGKCTRNRDDLPQYAIDFARYVYDNGIVYRSEIGTMFGRNKNSVESALVTFDSFFPLYEDSDENGLVLIGWNYDIDDRRP